MASDNTTRPVWLQDPNHPGVLFLDGHPFRIRIGTKSPFVLEHDSQASRAYWSLTNAKRDAEREANELEVFHGN